MSYHAKAQANWAATDAAQRRKLLAELDADEALHNHDFAGLPVHLQTALIDRTPPDDVGPPPADDDDDHPTRGRRKKADD